MAFSKLAAGVAVAAMAFAAAQAKADVILWIADTNGNIGQVDITTQSVVAGSVHNTGQGLTDIGFTQNGTLYGTTFTGLYTLNTSTGAATLVHAYSGESGMNALVGNGTSLLGASYADDNLYTVNPANAGLTTVRTEPYASAGDLAFSGSTLFESGVDFNTGNDALVNASTGAIIGDFHAGAQTFPGLFALADDGTTMYAVQGAAVYTVNLTNASLTLLFNYGVATLGNANGAAFFSEASIPGSAPEPSSLAILGAAIAGLGLIARRRKTT